MATIVSVKATQISGSRGNPTKVDVKLSDGTLARAAVPTVAYTGFYKALRRFGGLDYLGKCVLKDVDWVNSIIGPALVGKDPAEQTAIADIMVQTLDGTVNGGVWCKQKLGANAILAVSPAVCKAGASVKKISLYKNVANLAGNKNLVLPVPAFNVINGGSHAGNKLATQNYDGSQKISGDSLKDLYKKFAIEHSIVSIVDSFDQDDCEQYSKMTSEEYAIVSIEDPFDEDDWVHYTKTISEMGKQVQILGDDLLVTNPKVNQTGSVTESIEAVRMSKKAGWGVMASQPSGETVDTFIAELLVGLATVTATLTPNVVAGHLSVANVSSYTLFDSGATHSFISTDHVNANQSHVGKYVTSQTFRTSLPSGDVLESTQFLRAVPVIVSNRELYVDLIILGMCNYDVILGMDFLTKYNASIECGMRSVTFRPNIEDEFTFKAEPCPKQKAISMLSSRCQGFLASVVDTTQEERAKLEDIPGQIKSGAPCRSECLAKYNQLLRIEELGSEALYAGANFRPC